MKNKRSVAVICGILLMGPAILNQTQNEDAVISVEAAEQLSVMQNGDFSQGTDSWAIWNGEGGDSTFAVTDEQAQVTVHSIAGMHPEWNIPISWSTQLSQEGIAVEANQRYQLSFDAKSTVARPIVVEYTDLLGNLKEEFFITEDMQTFTHEFETIQAATAHFKYLLGNVQFDGHTTPEEEHTLTFDNVSLKSLGEAAVDTGERDWQLTWSDEFDGESLDLTKWRIDEGNGFFSGDEWVNGWGNNEKQYYHEDNVTVGDGKLVLEAREEQVTDEHGTYDYTSGKIMSDGLFSQTYGRFEASMKLPGGQGYWPAFWMMPQDDTYGGWAASGEIDIMENRGSATDLVGGAIHYGGQWPLNTYSAGDYDFTGENRTTDFNTYSVEWEPEEIRWFVNDELYYKTSEWHTENGIYPAPFNQEFFMIMNLAVGGWYGGEPDATTEFPGQIEVDYVRVYEDANADYDKSPTPKDPDVEEEPEPDDGLDRAPANWQAVGENLIVDGSFDDTTTFGDPDNISTWNVFNLANFDPNGGKAAFSVVDNVLNADIQQVGWNWWQIQLFQDLTLTEGTYKLAFDMSSEQARDMRVELVDSGEGIQTFAVNDNEETQEFVFHVGADGSSRLLFGFGREHTEVEPTVPYLMTLDNVTLTAAEPVAEIPAEPTPDEEDGEWVYIGDNLIQDGTFEQTTEFGDSQNLLTWNTHNQGDYENWAGLAEFSVIDEVLNAKIKQVGWDWWQIQLFQNVNVPSGTYKLSFDMASESERNVRVELKDSGLDIMDFTINEEMNTYEAIVEIADDADLQLLFGFGRLPNDEELDVPYTITLDNVSLRAVEFVVDEEPVEEEPVDKEDPEEAKEEELKEKEKEAKEKLKEEEKEAREELKEQEKEAREKLKEEEKEAKDDAKNEKLPKTATAAWTVGALGLTGVTSGAGIKFFKRKR
ncbi:glycoside hydrolase family 16 protein [Alkalibacterium sp. f15]|uniref:glycoside hydrolase family 16 protein n=1 Tax=Alkalibacterium sp. f15 TaxID=3414029 RepID=UPI003BF896F7